MSLKPQIRLILGGGGARGIAHIGALEVLERYFEVAGIVGTSMGAIVGGLYAAGRTPGELYELVNSLRFNRFLDLFASNPTTGFIAGGGGFEGYLRELAEGTRIEYCRIPFVAVSYDLLKKRTVLLDHGDLGLAMRASSSLPMVFYPVQDEGRVLIDGGIEYPLPLAFLDCLPKFNCSVAVNVLPIVEIEPLHMGLEPGPRSSGKRTSTLEVGIEALRCNQGFLAASAIAAHPVDILIQACMENLRLRDLLKIEEFYRLGYKQTEKAVNDFLKRKSEPDK